MKRTIAAAALLLLLVGCSSAPEPEAADEPEPEPEAEAAVDVAAIEAIEAELDANLEGRDLGLYVHGVEAGGGDRVRVLTQLEESQTAEADAICNNTTAAAGQSGVEVSGVDVAAAGGRNIAHCEPL